MRVRKLNESVKNAPANESFAVRHKNGNWVSKYYTVTSSSIPAKFNTREEAEKFISEDGKDPNWNKYYDIVELENEPLEEKLIEFDPNDWEEEDIKFWNHIDWQKNGYSDFARTDDTITAKVTKYSMHNDPETKEVTMCKYFRANPIYPPYYAAVEKPFDNCVGPMYDGHKAGKVDIHDRYETQEVYDLLSEAHNLVEDVVDVEETTGPKLPVTLLSAEQVRNIARTGLKKGKFISLGYLRKIPVAAQFASGKINKITGEVYPIVKIIKLIEDNGVTGIEYGQLKAIKKRNARTEAEVKQILGELTPEEAEEQSPVPTEWVVKNVIQIHPTTGNELLAYYPLGGTAKVKYYVSINGDDYKEVHRDDIRQWMTPGAAQKELEKTFDASMKGKYDNEENETVNFNYRLITQLYQLRQGDTVLGADFIKTPKRRNKLTLNNTDNVKTVETTDETTATEEVTESKKALKETFKSDEVFTDLKDRAIANYDGNNIEEAVHQAIDEGLIYDEDIYDLAEKYINGGEVLDLYYDFLFDDLYAELKKWDEEDLLKEDLGEDVGEYQEWVDYDMKKYGRISKETFDNLRKAGLTAVKDEYGDYEVIPHEKIHEACKKRKVDKKLEESIIYTSEGLNNAMKEFAMIVRDWKKTHVDSQEEKVIAESNWDDDSFNAFIATLEG